MSETTNNVDDRLIDATRAKLEAEAAAALQLAERNRAEARKADAEARSFDAIAHNSELTNEVAAIQAEKAHEARRIELTNDHYHYLYRFTEAVAAGSVRKCIDKLVVWQRQSAHLEEKPPIEIEFFSPGGSVIDGMALFDFIQQLRAAGHHVTTSATGYAASMGGILLQAGDKRVMGREAYVLIHEVSFGAAGKIGEIEDEVAFIKKIQDRVLDIFASRSKEAAAREDTQCTKPLTKRQLKAGWNRKDWWLSSDECLIHGIVDEVR